MFKLGGPSQQKGEGFTPWQGWKWKVFHAEWISWTGRQGILHRLQSLHLDQLRWIGGLSSNLPPWLCQCSRRKPTSVSSYCHSWMGLVQCMSLWYGLRSHVQPDIRMMRLISIYWQEQNIIPQLKSMHIGPSVDVFGWYKGPGPSWKHMKGTALQLELWTRIQESHSVPILMSQKAKIIIKARTSSAVFSPISFLCIIAPLGFGLA